jgi:hypothetical protein
MTHGETVSPHPRGQTALVGTSVAVSTAYFALH